MVCEQFGAIQCRESYVSMVAIPIVQAACVMGIVLKTGSCGVVSWPGWSTNAYHRLLSRRRKTAPAVQTRGDSVDRARAKLVRETKRGRAPRRALAGLLSGTASPPVGARRRSPG